MCRGKLLAAGVTPSILDPINFLLADDTVYNNTYENTGQTTGKLKFVKENRKVCRVHKGTEEAYRFGSLGGPGSMAGDLSVPKNTASQIIIYSK